MRGACGTGHAEASSGTGTGELAQPALQAVERQRDALRRRGGERIERNRRDAELRMAGRQGQPFRAGRQIDREREGRARKVRQAEDAEAAHFQQPGQRRGGARHALDDPHPVIGDEHETPIQQPEQQVRLARTGGADQEHPRTIARCAAAMDLHGAHHDDSSPATEARFRNPDQSILAAGRFPGLAGVVGPCERHAT